MADSTIIAWTNSTFNIAWGCVKISPGCKNCYAETGSSRYGHSVWGPGAPRRTFTEAHWNEPLKWNRKAEAAGTRWRVFTSSMCDNCEDHPTITAEREKLWPLIRKTPMLDWQFLTKRADRLASCLPKDWGEKGYPNVWLGVSVENQEYADKRIPLLLAIPAAVHFISYEPALEAINIERYLQANPYQRIPGGYRGDRKELMRKLEWVICGGESGPGYRHMQVEWARSVRKQCADNKVAFFFKQSSAPRTEMGIELDGQIVREYPQELVQLKSSLF